MMVMDLKQTVLGCSGDVYILVDIFGQKISDLLRPIMLLTIRES